MTGYFAQGRTRPYPYYKCFRRACPTRTKSYPALAVHDEFRLFLAELSVPDASVASVVANVVGAHSEKTEQTRVGLARRKDEAERIRNQLQELISMRAARLVSDDDFLMQQERLQRQLFSMRAADYQDDGASLTGADISDLTGVLADLNVAWQRVPNSARRGFGQLVLPVGFVFRRVRTAEKGLLLSTFGLSDAHQSNMAASTGVEPVFRR